MTDFKSMTKKQRLEAFEILVYSINNHSGNYGWDYLDSDDLIDMWKRLDRFTKHRIKYSMMDHLYVVLEPYIRDTLQQLWGHCDGQQKNIVQLWRKVFFSAHEDDQIDFLESNVEYYEDGLGLKGEREGYDWDSFSCQLLERGQTSKYDLITKAPQDYSVGVYGCGKCPCLKPVDSLFKCFKPYLQRNGLHPDSDIPIDMRK